MSQFDLDAILISLACEFDLRYERLFSYLQDDVARKRPTIDLVLNLLCRDEDSRLSCRGRFDAGSPLVRHCLIELRTDVQAIEPSTLARFVCPEAQLVGLLLETGQLDQRLASCCTLETTPSTKIGELAVSPGTATQVAAISRSRNVRSVWLHGPAGGDSVNIARAMARAAKLGLLLLDASRLGLEGAEVLVDFARREACYRSALLCIDGAEHLLEDPNLMMRIAANLRSRSCFTAFVANKAIPQHLLGLSVPIEVPLPMAAQRQRCWAKAMARHRVHSDAASVQSLAACFRLAPLRIAAAVDDAVLRSGRRATLADFQTAARAQSGEALSAVASKVDAKANWDDLVLPADCVLQLRELCARVEQHDRVFHDWGFAQRPSRGRATAALFSGASGTGKTMAAEVVAKRLGLDLYRIDLSRVVDKYIGETEKNLDRVFAAAEDSNAILFFDEADALFGKRTEVKDAHDNYANVKVACLLQKLEGHSGVVVLATNLPGHIDEAFARRIAVHVHFPFPDEAARLRLWQQAWPQSTPVADAVDRAMLARELRLAGGSIAGIALYAASLAAADGDILQPRHVLHAARRELAKGGSSTALPPALQALA